jgi:hypothetical protein
MKFKYSFLFSLIKTSILICVYTNNQEESIEQEPNDKNKNISSKSLIKKPNNPNKYINKIYKNNNSIIFQQGYPINQQKTKPGILHIKKQILFNGKKIIITGNKKRIYLLIKKGFIII